MPKSSAKREEASVIIDAAAHVAGHVLSKAAARLRVHKHVKQAKGDVRRGEKLKAAEKKHRANLAAHAEASKNVTKKSPSKVRAKHLLNAVKLHLVGSRLASRKAKLEGSHEHRVKELEAMSEHSRAAKQALHHPAVAHRRSGKPKAQPAQLKAAQDRKKAAKKAGAAVHPSTPPPAKKAPAPHRLANVRHQYWHHYENDPKKPIDPKHLQS